MAKNRSRSPWIRVSGKEGAILLSAEAVRLLVEGGERYLCVTQDRESGLICLYPLEMPDNTVNVVKFYGKSKNVWVPKIYVSSVADALEKGKRYPLIWNDLLQRAEVGLPVPVQET